MKGNKDTEVILCHGDCDPLVPYKWGQMTASLLKQFSSKIDFRTYRGLGHSSNDEVGKAWVPLYHEYTSSVK